MTTQTSIQPKQTPGRGKPRMPTGFTLGKVIGTCDGYPIYADLTDNHGVVRFYCGKVQPFQRLTLDSVITAPGLLYETAKITA